MLTRRVVRWSIVLFLLASLPVLTALAQPSGAAAVECDLVVGLPSSGYTGTIDYATISAALTYLKGRNTPLPADYALCVLDGKYNEQIGISDNSADNIAQLKNLQLVAYPDGDNERPVIDGTGIYYRQWHAPLVSIQESGVWFSGFEVRSSHSRGISIGAVDGQGDKLHDITLDNLSVHDNWGDGIVANGQSGTSPNVIRKNPYNIVVQNSEIYRNGRKARTMPVVFEGHRIEGVINPNAWQFIDPGLDPLNPGPDPEQDPWNNPFWQGRFVTDPHNSPAGSEHMSYFPHEDLDAISVILDASGNLDRMLVSGPAGERTIPGHHATGGADIKMDGADILEFHRNTGRWEVVYSGDAVQAANTACKNINVDGFELLDDGRLLLSFSYETCAALTLSGKQIYPGDMVVYNNGAYDYYAGNYERWGLTATENLRDFAFDPSGNVVALIKTDKNLHQTAVPTGSSVANWTRYMNAELAYPAGQFQFNPLSSDIDAVSIRPGSAGKPRLFIGGEAEGAVGLGFTATYGSKALNNRIYWNYGEGLSFFFNAKEATAIGNVVYDNLHSSLYFNDVQTATVDSNFVYCSDDWRFWGMTQNQKGHNPGNGLANRDEKYGQEASLDPDSATMPSSDLTITNNIVAGCNQNFFVDKAKGSPGDGQPTHGLIVLHNTFVGARAEPPAKIDSVQLLNNISYTYSMFADNLIAQPPHVPNSTAAGPVPTGLTVRNNLYSPASFYTGQPATSVVADPKLANFYGPMIAGVVNAAWYQLLPDSPAKDAGTTDVLSPVDHDFFHNARPAGAPDIGAHEAGPIAACNKQEPEDVPPIDIAMGDVVCSTLSSDYDMETGQYIHTDWRDSYYIHMPVEGYVLFDVQIVDIQDMNLMTYLWGNGVNVVSEEIWKNGTYLLFHHLYPGDYHFDIFDNVQIENNYAKYRIAMSSPLLISAAAAGLGTGNVGGVAFQSGDILAYSHLNTGEERWRMFFDASDVGITRNVTNIAVSNADRILLTVSAEQTVQGVGDATPRDFLVFDGGQYGADTIGTFTMGMKGDDHQLNTFGERLDGLDGWVNGYNRCYGFPVSTIGISRVKGWFGDVKQDNEDIFCKVYDASQAEPFRPWDWFFDVDGVRDAPASEPPAGHVEGLPPGNVFALAYNDAVDMMYLTTRHNGDIAGNAVTKQDILAIDYPSYAWSGLVWHGPDHGWNYTIDAFEWNGW